MFKVLSSLSTPGLKEEDALDAMRKKASTKGFNLSNNEMESQFLTDFGFSLRENELVQDNLWHQIHPQQSARTDSARSHRPHQSHHMTIDPELASKFKALLLLCEPQNVKKEDVKELRQMLQLIPYFKTVQSKDGEELKEDDFLFLAKNLKIKEYERGETIMD